MMSKLKKYVPVIGIVTVFLLILAGGLMCRKEVRASQPMSDEAWFISYFDTISNKIEKIVAGLGGNEENSFEGIARVEMTRPDQAGFDRNSTIQVFSDYYGHIRDIPEEKFIQDGFFTGQSKVTFTLSNRVDGDGTSLPDPMIIVDNFSPEGCIKINKLWAFHRAIDLKNGDIPVLPQEPNLTPNTEPISDNEIVTLPARTSFGCYKGPNGGLYYVSVLVKMWR